MLKRMMLLATIGATVAAFVAPTASAAFEASKWSKGGVNDLAEGGTIEGAGQLKFNATSGLGGVECHVIAHAILKANSGVGGITQFIASNCMTFGFLATICGTNATPVNPTITNQVDGIKTWAIDAEKTGANKRIRITEVVIDNTLPERGQNCPVVNKDEIQVQGPAVAVPPFMTPDSPTAMTTLTLGGEVNTSIGLAKVEGVIALFNNGEATKGGSGTYGIT